MTDALVLTNFFILVILEVTNQVLKRTGALEIEATVLTPSLMLWWQPCQCPACFLVTSSFCAHCSQCHHSQDQHLHLHCLPCLCGSLGQSSFSDGWVQGFPRLRIKESLEWLIGIRKAIIFIVTFYYSARRQIEISFGKKHVRWVQESSRCRPSSCSLAGVLWTEVCSPSDDDGYMGGGVFAN